MKELKVKLMDQDPDSDKTVELLIWESHGTLHFTAKGYGDSESKPGLGIPLEIEVWQGELRVVVWSDINNPEPTHIINLEGALESNYKE